MATAVFDVDPRTLHVPPSRRSGADPFKLHRQMAQFGASTTGMPVPWVYRGSDGKFQLYNEVTRATRIAKLAPGTLIRVEVVGDLAGPVGHPPEVQEFAAEKGFSSYLDAVVDLARRAFPSSALCVSLGQDAEDESQ